jgi:hypothetical protein
MEGSKYTSTYFELWQWLNLTDQFHVTVVLAIEKIIGTH